MQKCHECLGEFDYLCNDLCLNCQKEIEAKEGYTMELAHGKITNVIQCRECQNDAYAFGNGAVLGCCEHQIQYLTSNKEGKQMSETNAKVSQTQNSKSRFIFVLVAAQLQGFAGYFKKRDAHLSAWLYWAGKCIQAFINGAELPEEPEGIDSFDSPLSDGIAANITFAGYQLQSLGIAISMWDDDDLGKDDAFAHLLTRISGVLITLGNK